MKATIFILVLLVGGQALGWSCPQQGDVDGDGRPDRLQRSIKAIRISTAKGQLTLPVAPPAVDRVCIADLDGDKRAEVVLAVFRANPKDGTVRRRLMVLELSGDQVRTLVRDLPGPGRLLTFGITDRDGDGASEIVAAFQGGTVSTLAYRLQGGKLVQVSVQTAGAVPPSWGVIQQPSFGADVPVPALLGKWQPTFERTTARTRPIKLKPGLRNAANRKAFRWVRGRARTHLSRNGFTVVRPPTAPLEFHSLYIENQYQELPSFVTSDAALHLTHLLLEHTLVQMEQQVLAPALGRLVHLLLERTERLAGRAPPELRAALQRIRIRLATAAALLSGDSNTLGADIAKGVTAELKRIERASGPRRNPQRLDYESFVVRGHYTASPLLRRYFRARLLLSQSAITDPGEAALLTALLVSQPDTRELLGWLEAFDRTLAGEPANLAPVQLVPHLRRVYGERPGWGDLTKDGNWLAELHRPVRGGDLEPVVTVLARRWPPENDMLTVGVHVDHRPYPDVLDVLTILGSARARKLLQPQMPRWRKLGSRLDRAASLLRQGQLTAGRSLGERWLLALRWLLLPYPEGYPTFQRTEAWADHSLVTAAASLAEQRRDKILYVRPPVIWREGGAEDTLPPARASYVEPVPELYGELAQMLADLRAAYLHFGGEALEQARVRKGGRKPAEILSNGERLLRFLRGAARKELSSGLSRAEHERLSEIGSRFEEILAGRGKLRLDPVPVIADVYYFGEPETGVKKPLLLATGPVDMVVVAVPIGKRLVLTRGAVFSFYSFVAEQPLTDEQWRQQLRQGKAPAPPTWAAPIPQRPSAPSPGSKRL